MRLQTERCGLATRVRAASTAQRALLSQPHSEAFCIKPGRHAALAAREAKALVEYVKRIHINRISTACAPYAANLYTQQPVYMAQQVQAKQRELQSKLEAMLSSVEDERLRPMRKQGFLAMAKCCDLSDPTAYQQCLQKAQLPEQRASQVVQTELNDFQSRLQRAIATCQDDVKDGSRAASDQIFFTPSSQRLLAWYTHIYQGRRRTDGV